jgi:glycerol kinase
LPFIHADKNQTQANLIGIPVQRPRMRETTALGAAIAAGLAVGVWQDLEELKTVNVEGRTTFTPAITKEASASMFARWTKAVEMSKGWAN